jgi:hypothetical protein
LKERGWFSIPVVYNNNRRAILAMEKGTPGERVFADAFDAQANLTLDAVIAEPEKPRRGDDASGPTGRQVLEPGARPRNLL